MGDAPAIVDEPEFREAVASRAGALLGLAARLAGADAPGEDPSSLLTRPLVATAHSQASQVEELLDAYGALRNERWRAFRSVVAAIKAFSRAHYSVLHLVHAAPAYCLRPVEGDLATTLGELRAFTAGVACAASRRLLQAAAPLHLEARAVDLCEERLPPGRLPQDRALRHVDDVAGTVARLATAFLNLSEEATDLAPGAPAALPEESRVRRLAEDFHNLQALYDTHVTSTDVEQGDPELLSLRGHASVVYHLLETATDLIHYDERHVLRAAAAEAPALAGDDEAGCVAAAQLRTMVREHVLTFAARYVGAGRALSQQLLRRYAEQGEITVPVPRYRGFHVRPSTLVARVTYHYGSAVTMTLEDETYDATFPLELFRANELINAKKRRLLAGEIARLLDGAEVAEPDATRAVRDVLMRLAADAKVILYEQPLPPIEGELRAGQPVLGFVVEAVARLLALGKIDISLPVAATFRGDRRVLADLHLLAANGYGEDAYGNNIALPAELSYLRR